MSTELDIQIELLEAEKADSYHLIHFALSCVTVGWWIPVWIIHAMIVANAHNTVDKQIEVLKRVDALERSES